MRIFSVRNENNVISEYVSVCTDISERHLLLEELNQSVYFDALTGLPNSVLLKQEFQDSINQGKSKNKKHYFVAFNIDRFSYINMMYGYRTGDQLLIEVANRIKHNLRDKDTVYRFVGDVYILLIRDIEEVETVINIVDRVFDLIRKPFIIDEKEISITASFSISLYPDDGMSFENLLKNAETALREAKHEGKNAIKFFSEKMNEKATRWFLLGNQLNGAIQNNELRLYYQIQVDSKTEEVIGVEALVRWQHPEFGLLTPDEFIPFAEVSGLIIPLGYWVIESVFKQASEHCKKGYKCIKYSINLSAKQLEDNDIINRIGELLRKYELDSRIFVFEITESNAMLNPDVSYRVLSYLKTMGFSLAMDDFGTGHSSLSVLNQFPIDILKIDRSFITNVAKNEKKKRLTLAILAMTEIVGLTTVAEGVETMDDVVFLLNYNCDYLQGYYFSKPVNLEKFTEILESM